MSNADADAVRITSRAGFIWGIVTVILGVLAIAAPLISGITVATLVGLFLLAAGLAQTIFAFKAGSFGEGLFTFLFGAFAVLAGLLMVARPLVGLASVTMVLAVYFFVDGIYGIFAAFRIKPAEGWGWMLVSAIAAVALGVMILMDWPVSGQWAVGTLVGIRLLFAGWSMMALGGAGDALADEVDGV